MKWSSLNHTQRRNMENEYDKRHAGDKPVEPVFEAPEESDRIAVTTEGSTHLYCFMEDNGRRTDHPTSKGHLRVVGSSEHIEIHLPIDAIPKLIEQLQNLCDDMAQFDNLGRLHAEAKRKYYQDIKAYESKREQDLEQALEAGKFTEHQIKTDLDDIPF